MEKRILNEHYEELAEQLLKERDELAYIANSSAKIRYLESNVARKNGKDKLVLGECEKVPAKYKWAITADYTITLFKPNIEHMNDKKIKILLFHELLHIGIDKAPDGTESYRIEKHDLEDFKTIIDLYGTDWAF